MICATRAMEAQTILVVVAVIATFVVLVELNEIVRTGDRHP